MQRHFVSVPFETSLSVSALSGFENFRQARAGER
jgi:hypothetical protein